MLGSEHGLEAALMPLETSLMVPIIFIIVLFLYLGREYICKMLFWNAGMLCFRFVMIQWTLGCFLEQSKAVRTPRPSNSKSWRPLKYPNPSNSGA